MKGELEAGLEEAGEKVQGDKLGGWERWTNGEIKHFQHFEGKPSIELECLAHFLSKPVNGLQ